MDLELLELLICPNCGPEYCSPKQGGTELNYRLSYRSQEQDLLCLACGASYQIRNGLPILLVQKKELGSEEKAPTWPLTDAVARGGDGESQS